MRRTVLWCMPWTVIPVPLFLRVMRPVSLPWCRLARVGRPTWTSRLVAAGARLRLEVRTVPLIGLITPPLYGATASD